jgi:hypothetical protein
MCDQSRQQQQVSCDPSHGARHIQLLLLLPRQSSFLRQLVQRRQLQQQLLLSRHMEASPLCKQQGSSHTAA